MIFRNEITDVHTHRRDAQGAVISVAPDEVRRPDLWYSVGIHPWDTPRYAGEPELMLAAVGAVRRAAADPRVLAVGEAGLDKLRGADIGTQLQLFEAQARIAEEVRKPLIMHVVRAADEMLALHRRLRPEQPWIWHGFRGGPQQARQLVSHGIYLSLGRRYNPDVPGAVDARYLLRETDDS